MVCKKCKAKCEENSIYCEQCGHPTGIVKEQYSSIKFFFSEYSKNKSNYTKHIGYSFVALIFGILPISLSIWFSVKTNFIENELIRYFVSNLLFLIFIPFLLTPFSNKNGFEQESNSFTQYFKNLSAYGRYFLLTLIGIVYLMFFKFICQGDAILNLVRLVMVIYGIAIILPVSYLMENREMNVIQGVKKGYQSGKHTVRWQYFFLSFLLFILNIVGLLVAFIVFRFKFYSESMNTITQLLSFGIAGFWLLFSMPFTWNTIQKYNRFLDSQKVFDYENKLV